MPIEFVCTGCGKTLRVDDSAAGKRVKCPRCSQVVRVAPPSTDDLVPLGADDLEPVYQDPLAPHFPPLPRSAMPPHPADRPPVDPQFLREALNEYSVTPGPPSPFDPAYQSSGGGWHAPGDPNPFQSPRELSQIRRMGSSSSAIKSRVSGPAIGLMVMGGLGAAVQCLALALNLFGALAQGGQNGAPALFEGGFGAVSSAVGLMMSALVIFGGYKMMSLESHGLAMAASIVALIPCISPCCLLGIPIGIWSLVVLNDSEVKDAFS